MVVASRADAMRDSFVRCARQKKEMEKNEKKYGEIFRPVEKT